jgi:SAM-dependent methyltransferase
LGPGAGANIPLFAHLGVRYHGVEGSPSMAAALRERFPQFRDTLAAGDFVEAIPFSGPFDLVVDRASITHNSTEAIRKCLANIQSLLAPGGVLLGIDWFSTVHDEFRNGREAEDANTRTDFKTGQFEGLGRVHFSDEAHLRDLLGGYRIDVLEHKTVVTRAPAPKNFGSWNFAARKGGA